MSIDDAPGIQTLTPDDITPDGWKDVYPGEAWEQGSDIYLTACGYHPVPFGTYPDELGYWSVDYAPGFSYAIARGWIALDGTTIVEGDIDYTPPHWDDILNLADVGRGEPTELYGVPIPADPKFHRVVDQHLLDIPEAAADHHWRFVYEALIIAWHAHREDANVNGLLPVFSYGAVNLATAKGWLERNLLRPERPGLTHKAGTVDPFA